MKERRFDIMVRIQFGVLLLMGAAFMIGATRSLLDPSIQEWTTMVQYMHPKLTSLPVAVMFFMPVPIGIVLMVICQSQQRIIAAASVTLYIVAILMTLAITLPINSRVLQPDAMTTTMQTQEKTEWQWANVMRAAFGSASLFVLLPLMRRRENDLSANSAKQES